MPTHIILSDVSVGNINQEKNNFKNRNYSTNEK